MPEPAPKNARPRVYEPIETPRGRVITDEIPIGEPRSTSAAITPSQNKEPRDAPPNESSAVPPSESTNECEIRESRAAGQTFGSMHAGTVAPPPGSGHEEPSGLSDEKRTRPRPRARENPNRTGRAARFSDGLPEGEARSNARQSRVRGEYGEGEARPQGAVVGWSVEGERRRRRRWRERGARALKTREEKKRER